MNNSLQRGLSLLEVLLSISIIAILIVMSVRLFSIAMLNTRVAESISQLKRLTRASYQWLETQSQQDFSNANGGTKITVNKLTSANLISAQDGTTPWGGTVTIKPNPNDKTQVRIIFANVPAHACKNLGREMENVAISATTPAQCNAAENTFIANF